jgi:hydroxymethylpyrimidine pyrophosphatase-like HAD family hydrolase
MKAWYEHELNTRITEVYKKYTIKDFFDWWSDGSDDWLELRFDTWKFSELVLKKIKCYKNLNSVFVNNYRQIEQVLNIIGTQSNVWYGVNPRRMVRDSKGNFKFSGKDVNVSKIKYVFVDIDRTIKNGPATQNDLMNTDFLATELLTELSKENFANNYIKVCTGNGLQLLLKLDLPIDMPMPTLHESGQVYVEPFEFTTLKQTIKNGIGKVLLKFSERFKSYNVEIDKTGFNVGRIGALPFSFNIKFEKPVMRGMVEIKNITPNKGLTEYILSLNEDKEYKQKVIKYHKTRDSIILHKEYNIKNNKLKQNVLVDLLLNYKFPAGGINNTLWYALKILLHHKGICKLDSEYVEFHEHLKVLHGRSFTDNGLEPQFKNNFNGVFTETDISKVPLLVNKYLRQHEIYCPKLNVSAYHKPLFPVSPNGYMRQPTQVNITPKVAALERVNLNFNFQFRLFECKDDPLDDIKSYNIALNSIRTGEFLPSHMLCDFQLKNLSPFAKILIEKQLYETFVNFVHDYIDKWQPKLTVYMMKHYMQDFINYKRF